MLEIRVPEEIRDFQPKIIGSFNGRQLLCIACAFPFCFVILRYLSPIVTRDVAAFLCFPPAALAYFMGWREIYGMKPEKFIRSIFVNRFLAPAHRKYKTKNAHEELFNLLSEVEEMSMTTAEQKKKKGAEKSRYKLSPKAYR